jgi:hypothetical protein
MPPFDYSEKIALDVPADVSHDTRRLAIFDYEPSHIASPVDDPETLILSHNETIFDAGVFSFLEDLNRGYLKRFFLFIRQRLDVSLFIGTVTSEISSKKVKF